MLDAREPRFDLQEFVDDDDVRVLRVNADGALVSLDLFTDAVVGVFGYVHGMFDDGSRGD